MKKKIGIWLDFSEANVITLDGESANTKTITSEIEHRTPKGGSRSKTPWGPMDKISESKFLARRKRQEHRYFEKIINVIEANQQLYLFGPAEAKMRFRTMLENDRPKSLEIIGMDTADSMTENQKIAQVRSFFNAL